MSFSAPCPALRRKCITVVRSRRTCSSLWYQFFIPAHVATALISPVQNMLDGRVSHKKVVESMLAEAPDLSSEMQLGLLYPNAPLSEYTTKEGTQCSCRVQRCVECDAWHSQQCSGSQP